MKHGKEGLESYAEIDMLTKTTVTNIRRTINSENKGVAKHEYFILFVTQRLNISQEAVGQSIKRKEQCKQ